MNSITQNYEYLLKKVLLKELNATFKKEKIKVAISLIIYFNMDQPIVFLDN